MPVSLSSRDGVAALTLQAQHTYIKSTAVCQPTIATQRQTVVCQACHASQDTHMGPAVTAMPTLALIQLVSAYLSTDLLGYTMHRITCRPPKIAPTCTHTQQQGSSAASELCCADGRQRVTWHIRGAVKGRCALRAGWARQACKAPTAASGTFGVKDHKLAASLWGVHVHVCRPPHSPSLVRK